MAECTRHALRYLERRQVTNQTHVALALAHASIWFAFFNRPFRNRAPFSSITSLKNVAFVTLHKLFNLSQCPLDQLRQENAKFYDVVGRIFCLSEKHPNVFWCSAYLHYMARGADFQVGGLTRRTRKREPTRGRPRGLFF